MRWSEKFELEYQCFLKLYSQINCIRYYINNFVTTLALPSNFSDLNELAWISGNYLIYFDEFCELAIWYKTQIKTKYTCMSISLSSVPEFIFFIPQQWCRWLQTPNSSVPRLIVVVVFIYIIIWFNFGGKLHDNHWSVKVLVKVLIGSTIRDWNWYTVYIPWWNTYTVVNSCFLIKKILSPHVYLICCPFCIWSNGIGLGLQKFK